MTVRTPLCDLLGIEHPIVGFTPSEHVAAAVSRAGGLGVLGCVRFNDPAELDAVLDLDGREHRRPPVRHRRGHAGHRPHRGRGQPTCSQLIPEAHRDFVEQTLLKLGVPPLPDDAQAADGVLGWLHSIARKHVEVALAHPAAADRERARLAAARRHRQRARPRHAGRRAGRQGRARAPAGGQRGGHRGRPGPRGGRPHRRDRHHGPGPRGRGRGRRAGAGARRGRDRLRPPDRGGARARRRRSLDGLGLAGHRRSTSSCPRPPRSSRPCCAATSSDTVRSRIYSGKPARLLKNRWTAAWEQPGAPEPLPMPLQNLLVSDAHQRLMRSGQPDVVPMPAGQIIGRMNEVRPVADVMADLIAETNEILDRLRRPAMMMGMRTSVSAGYWSAGPPPGAADLFEAAERIGIDQIWTAEAYGSDAWTPLAWWGSRTSRIKLGTAVSQLSARPPVTLAMTAMTMDHLTQGRVLLGVGTSNPQVVEGWYGQPYPRPLERTREYIDILRKVIARGEPVSYDGQHYQLPLPRRPGGHRPGQAAALDPAPLPHRDPRLPRRRGPEERGAGGRGRRRLERHLLLARHERLLRESPGRGFRPPRRPPFPRHVRRSRRPDGHHRR